MIPKKNIGDLYEPLYKTYVCTVCGRVTDENKLLMNLVIKGDGQSIGKGGDLADLDPPAPDKGSFNGINGLQYSPAPL